MREQGEEARVDQGPYPLCQGLHAGQRPLHHALHGKHAMSAVFGLMGILTSSDAASPCNHST